VYCVLPAEYFLPQYLLVELSVEVWYDWFHLLNSQEIVVKSGFYLDESTNFLSAAFTSSFYSFLFSKKIHCTWKTVKKKNNNNNMLKITFLFCITTVIITACCIYKV